MKTGFRLALGGAEEVFGVTPDLGTFAKAMGNGFPVAAVGGKQAVMDTWAGGGVMQAGTYSGNALSAAAAAATIDILATGEPYAPIEKTGGALIDGPGAHLRRQRRPRPPRRPSHPWSGCSSATSRPGTTATSSTTTPTSTRRRSGG